MKKTTLYCTRTDCYKDGNSLLACPFHCNLVLINCQAVKAVSNRIAEKKEKKYEI